MQYIQGHLQKNLKRWEGKKWYHQRFDGSPYFLHFIAEAEITTHIQRKNGGDFSMHYCFFDNGKADWYILMDDIERVSTIVSTMNSKDLVTLWAEDEANFYHACSTIVEQDLQNLSDKELIRTHDQFVETILRKNSSSSMIDGFALGTDEIIFQKIKKVFDASTVKQHRRLAEVFSLLTAPVHASFVNEAELSLLKIIRMAKKEDLLDTLLSQNVKDQDPLIVNTKTGALLKEHQKNFFWLRNNYVSSYVLTTKDFIDDLRSIITAKIDIDEEIAKISVLSETHREKKDQLMDVLSLTKELRNIIAISEDFTHWQDERKKGTLWTMHYGSIFLQEISRRTGIDRENLKYITPREVSLVMEKKITEEQLQERKKTCVYYWDKEGFDVISGKSVENITKALFSKTDYSSVDDFRGLTASMGVATGPVKIVRSVTEMDKIKEGDILVAVMTRPDYVPAMKRASAIVTDEGGVTCHAAIVSRELNKPCIIGTKIATKVLKDDQIVTVNANHSWVRIVKRTNEL